jgi:hypothetical protein
MAAAGAKWTALPATLSVARAYIHCTVVDGLIYAIGGAEYTGNPALTATNLVEIYDPLTPSAGWVAGPTLPDATGEAPAFGFDSDAGHVLAGKIVIPGGGQWPEDWANSYVFDVASGSWSSFAPIVNARRNHTGFYYPEGNGELWIVGGRHEEDTNVLTQSEYYRMEEMSDLMLSLTMPGSSFGEGDTCSLGLDINNGMGAVDVDLYVLLSFGDQFWAYPSWENISQGLDFESMSVAAGTSSLEIIPTFTMPAVPPAGPFTFYAAMFEQGTPTTDTLLSSVATYTFSLE